MRHWLDGFDPDTRSRLWRAQIESPEDAIAFTAADLAHIIRISEDTAAEVIRLASVLLFPASKRMCSALSILQTLPRFLTTGDRGLDDLLAGGVPVGCITEIYGESGAGKTQLALQMCATAQWEVERGGLASPVIYIATEQRFPLDRFAEICSSFEDRGLLPAAALVDNSPSQSSSSSPSSLSNAPETIPIPPFSRYGENVHLIHLRDAETQHHIISYQLPTVLERTGARLVIVDSVAANFRGGIRFDVDDPTGETQVTTGGGGGMGDWADARDERFEMADAVFRLGQALKRSADRFGAAVVCVNQVSADVAGDGAGGTVFVGTGVTAGAGKGFTQVSRQTVDGGGGAEGGHWSIIAGGREWRGCPDPWPCVDGGGQCTTKNVEGTAAGGRRRASGQRGEWSEGAATKGQDVECRVCASRPSAFL
ncbi:P-loop containing nucleoside triphosphate hydrolase protein [Zopfochytrium polystomum]|nr:P-loop containing nucleoside triphosphate hydrolase protein [Zopfochytrium polystomum]